MRVNQIYAYLLLQCASRHRSEPLLRGERHRFGARAAGQIVALDGLGIGMNPALARVWKSPITTRSVSTPTMSRRGPTTAASTAIRSLFPMAA